MGSLGQLKKPGATSTTPSNRLSSSASNEEILAFSGDKFGTVLIEDEVLEKMPRKLLVDSLNKMEDLLEEALGDDPIRMEILKTIRFNHKAKDNNYATIFSEDGNLLIAKGMLEEGIWNRYEKNTHKTWWDSPWHPKGTTASDILPHELGHRLSYIAAQNYFGTKNVYNSDFWNYCKKVITDAKKEVGIMSRMGYKQASRTISEYASHNPKEGVAEAVADYSGNKKNANELSLAIWKRLKKDLKG